MAAVKWVPETVGPIRPLRRLLMAVPLFVVLTVSLLVLSGCASSPAVGGGKKPAPGAPNTVPPQWLRTELYLAAVPTPDWEAFLAERVTPRFPGGFTVFDAYGQWRPPQGEIRRLTTKVVVILHPPTPEAETAIEAIRKEYCEEFHQVSVLRSTTPALVSF
ncbi:MAG: DUF3574 domain-containing protein [Proteobacteria bacterium]|nr:DUF3574 domain-containing protein [Pseudomonadota bacterium]